MWNRKNISGVMLLGIILFLVALIAYTSSWRKITYIGQLQRKAAQQRDTIFHFDPNTITYEQLRELGFEKQAAVGIVKYRAMGKVFAIPEEFALCYGVNDSVYARLRPYIHIAPKYTAKLRERQRQWQHGDSIAPRRFVPRAFEPFSIDTVGVEYLRRIGFSTRQARALIEYRDRGEGIYDINELRDCFAVSTEMADTLERYIIFTPKDPHKGMVEINSADTIALLRVSGIGPKSVGHIVTYRHLLGGFYSIQQIAELNCITPENFARISKQIYCDSCNISKIDINFASADDLEQHPYMTRRAIRKIVEQRELKGGWTNVEEMISDDIFTKEQAKAIAPYLHFGIIPQDFVIPEPAE